MPGIPQHPRFEVDVAEGGMILIKQTDGISDDRPVVAIHPSDLPDLIERLSKVGDPRRRHDETNA
jgi:hypothetical protein